MSTSRLQISVAIAGHMTRMSRTLRRSERYDLVTSAAARMKRPFAALRGFYMGRRSPDLDLKAKVSSVHASAYVHF
jgi:hypothetical protein